MALNKRFRFPQSPSLGDVCMFDQVTPIESTPKLEVLHCASNASRSFSLKREKSREEIIFTLGLPAGNYMDWGFDVSLKSCYVCSKGIGENDIIFMYNDLGGFCSEECRHEQIAKDNLRKQFLKKRPLSSTMFNFAFEDQNYKVNLDLSLGLGFQAPIS